MLSAVLLLGLGGGVLYSMNEADKDRKRIISSTRRRSNHQSSDYELDFEPQQLPFDSEEYQIAADLDTGSLRTGMNRSIFANTLDDPNSRIVRMAPNSQGSIWEPKANSLAWNSIVRQKNRELGKSYFNPRTENNPGIILPAYRRAPTLMLLRSKNDLKGLGGDPERFYPFCKFEYPEDEVDDGRIPITEDLRYFSGPGSDDSYYDSRNTDVVTAFSTLGDPWGPVGIMKLNASKYPRPDMDRHDYVEFTPKETRHVSFNIPESRY